MAAAFLEVEFLSFSAKEINLTPGLPKGTEEQCRAVESTALHSSRPWMLLGSALLLLFAPGPCFLSSVTQVSGNPEEASVSLVS